MWCLRWASPLQISPFGVCPLQRPPYPGDYPQLHKAYLASGGPYRLGPLQKGKLGHSWHRVHGLWPNRLRCHPCQHHTLLRWHRLSVSHHLASQQLCTSRQYSCQASLLGGESLLTPPLIKLPPTGGQSSEDHGRQRTRGWGDSGQSASHPRGVQEKTSRQTPHQEGDLPSGATPNIPPTTAPESTPPQLGSRARTLSCDPARLATKYHSVGWKKDLEHVLKVYYKYNVTSYKEAEWVRLRDKFFTHFLLHKEEALGIKERCPMDYMLYIEEQFWRATGLRLNGL